MTTKKYQKIGYKRYGNEIMKSKKFTKRKMYHWKNVARSISTQLLFILPTLAFYNEIPFPNMRPLSKLKNERMKNPTSSSTIIFSSPDMETRLKQERPEKPAWMKCVNGVSPRTCALNEAVSRIADVSLEQANELIRIGAVWARFDSQESYELGMNEWGYSMSNEYSNDDDLFEYDLDEYIARLENDSTYKRVMEPQIVEAGTDLRIYPHPRRFPACYQINENRLLYEDTTFIVVDKPPMLPTQPDASNYFECCPGCVNDLLGPFESLDGEIVQRPLLCHRVDSCVGGCVVLSKDKNGQKVFSEFQVGAGMFQTKILS